MGVGCSHSIESGGFRKSFLLGVGSLQFIVIMGCSCIAQSSRAVPAIAWMAIGTWGSVPKPEKRKNGREWNRVDRQSQLSPSYPKIPSWPKVPSFVDTLNSQLGEILWLWDMGQHGTTIKWKTFSILP